MGYGDAEARAIGARLHHRGPDGLHVRLWPDAALIHARLAIIDLSKQGDQPLPDESGTRWTIVNGEIYNHHELRSRLESRGHRFQGRSDCEVVPHLHEEHGPAFAAGLRGMFAIASYDESSRTMVLARDRFGIKPLFYAPGRDGIAFASELRALRWLPHADMSVDEQALWDYTALLYVPAPRTFFRGIRVLEPGHYLEAGFSGGEFRSSMRAFHQWAFHVDRSLTLDRAEARTAELIDGAVASQLESDVPLGALLSGGIDSSLVSASAQNALRPGKLQTFNVQFPDAAFDETWAAVAVAQHIDSDHRTLSIEGGSSDWDDIAAILTHAGQPFADTSLFAVDAVSELMRRHVTVALSGDGGDEGFGGYDFFWQLNGISRLDSVPGPIRALLAFAAPALRPLSSKAARLGRRLNAIDWSDETAVIQYLLSWVREDEQKRFLPELRADSVRRHFEPRWPRDGGAKASRLERLSALGTEVRARLSLPNDYLFKVDIGSMRHSLEVRVPLLDEELFGFGLSLPHELKVSGRTGKRVLRAVAQKRLPRDVVEKKKWGFGIPVDTWAGDAFRRNVRDTLLAGSSAVANWFDRGIVRELVDAFTGQGDASGISRQGLYQRIVMLLAVHFVMEDVARDRAGAPLPLAGAVR